MISRSAVALFAMLAFASASAPVAGESLLGLSVNGQVIVPQGQLESFIYDVGDGRIHARTYFGDIRCAPADQSTTSTGGLLLELDKFSSKESEAIYQVFEDGEVQYNTAIGMIDIVTSADAGSAECTHFISAVGAITAANGEADPGTFWTGGFESPFRLEAETLSDAVSGGTLTIRFTLSNVSGVLVATDILTQFATDPDPLPDGVTGPQYDPAVGAVVDDVWEVPILWPGESASMDVSYTLDELLPAGTEIKTSIDAVTAFDRSGAEPLASGDAQISIINTSTAL